MSHDLVKLGRFLLISLASGALLFAQRSPFEEGNDDDFFIMLDSFAKYGGDIKVIDGLTGNNYTSANEVVMEFHSSMPKIMGGFHNMLLAYEAKNIKFRFEDGLAHAKELKKMADSFGIKGFYLNEDTFLGKERSIFSHLHKSPFYHLDELVVWELEHLEKEPDNKYAKHIHFEPETDTWRRRVVIQWNVVSNHGNQTRRSEKLQGLDLDTQFGFHESTVLHGRVHPNDFKDLKISYPIFIDRKKSSEEQIDYLQRAFVKNLRHIYDPFSWGARRDTRFQTGLARELRHHLSERGYKVTNREWFDPVISNFLNDVVYIQRHGYQSLYAAIARRPPLSDTRTNSATTSTCSIGSRKKTEKSVVPAASPETQLVADSTSKRQMERATSY